MTPSFVDERRGREHARRVAIPEDCRPVSLADPKPSSQTPVAITSPHAF
jgi:hypothetical protein